jgi:hypothetical protein
VRFSLRFQNNGIDNFGDRFVQWNAKESDGKVFDPYTGEELNWDKSNPRNGQWDMGHRYGKSYQKLHQDYMDGKISYEEFLSEYRSPQNYNPQSINGNRGRRYD